MGNFYNLETARKVDFRPALFNFQLSSAFEHVQQVVQVFFVFIREGYMSDLLLQL